MAVRESRTGRDGQLGGPLLTAIATDLARVGSGASLALRLRRSGQRVVDTLKPKDLEAWGVRYSPSYSSEREPVARDRLKRISS